MDIILFIQLIQALWVVFILLMPFFKLRLGVAAYLAYILLVPYMNVSIGSFNLQWNFVNIVILLAFFWDRTRHKCNSKIDWRPFLPFLIYYGICLLLMPMQQYVPFTEQLDSWRIQVMKFLILPFVMWNDVLADKNAINTYRRVALTCISIAIIYGLYLTTMPGLNPYMAGVCIANGEEFNLAYAAGNSALSNSTELVDGRMFGRISSVYSHPMTYGLILGLTFFYLYRIRNRVSKYFLWLFISLTLICIISCGVRSAIGGITISILFYVLQSRNTKMFLFMLGASGVLLIAMESSASLSDYIGSIYNDSDSVRGSSIEMRIEQFNGCLSEIRNCLYEGKGFGWNGYYIENYGAHPTLLYFESLVFVVVCNLGLLGIAVWLGMIYLIISFNNRKDRQTSAILNSLFIFYIVYACITGDYGYMQYFILFYVLMLAEDINNKQMIEISY